MIELGAGIQSEKFATEVVTFADLVGSDTDLSEIWARADTVFDSLVGHRLFTILHHDDSSGSVRRLYSSNPEKYPVGGTKKMGPTSWGELVLKQGRPFLGRDVAALKWAYPDYKVLVGLGLGSALNCPLRMGGKTLGTVNLIHVEGHFSAELLGIARVLAAILTPVFVAYADLQPVTYKNIVE